MFRDSFKYYKAKKIAPDLKDVVDFDNDSCTTFVSEYKISAKTELPPGVTPVDQWKAYTLLTHPGLIIIKNIFNLQAQRYWISRCLVVYPRYPNPNNLNNIFEPEVIKNWWRALIEVRDENERLHLKKSMRWATLGFHHDWNSKVYSEDKRSEFPTDLNRMTKFLSSCLNFDSFEPQAAIVNYYPIGSTLAGHTDHSEVNLSAPLFSFSFGQSAIFLIGGQDLETKPTAMYLRSGDVLVMSGMSRLCYHAVPRIFKADYEPWSVKGQKSQLIPPDLKEANRCTEWAIDAEMYEQVMDADFWEPFENYLKDSRINVNIRQVLNEHNSVLKYQ